MLRLIRAIFNCLISFFFCREILVRKLKHLMINGSSLFLKFEKFRIIQDYYFYLAHFIAQSLNHLHSSYIQISHDIYFPIIFQKIHYELYT